MKNRVIQYGCASEEGQLFYLQNLLFPEECDHIIEFSREHMVPAQIFDKKTGELVRDPTRNCTVHEILPGQSAQVDELETDLFKLFPDHPESAEPLQIIHYPQGGEYTLHYDFFDFTQPGMQDILQQRRQRYATLIMYLNDVEDGGNTSFPLLDIQVKPVKGDAILFWNVDDSDNLNKLSLHAGLPVIQGEKWIATKWVSR
jgi:prolyl 4-hydroxylase